MLTDEQKCKHQSFLYQIMNTADWGKFKALEYRCPCCGSTDLISEPEVPITTKCSRATNTKIDHVELYICNKCCAGWKDLFMETTYGDRIFDVEDL